MSSFMDRLMGGGRKNVTPAQSAKDRLKFVLVTDRTTISPEDLRKMQGEIIEVIRRYCRVSDEDVDLKFEQRDRENYLVADIPLKPNRGGNDGGSIRLETTLSTSDDADEDENDRPTERVDKSVVTPTPPSGPMPDNKTEEIPVLSPSETSS